MADDDHDDQYLVQQAMADIQIGHVFEAVDSGSALLAELLSKSKAVEVQYPDCILLDLNMPLLDGFRTLEVIKAHKDFSHIPVYVLSTSRSEEDRRASMSLGAQDFFAKPAQYSELKTIMNEICTRTHDLLQKKAIV